MSVLFVAVAQNGTGSAADKAAIQQVWVAYTNAVETGNADAYMALWADGGVQMPPGAPPNIGKDMIRARTEKGMAADAENNVVMNIDAKEITVLGDYAYSRGLYTVDVSGSDGNALAHVDGKFMTILRRQDDGSWKIYRDIFNSNVPAH
ncbi:MAG: nuclear transport factor 2 family protein [Deinococcales bacterium]